MTGAMELPKDLATLTLKGKLLEFSLAGGTVVQMESRPEAHIHSSRNAYGQVSSIQGSVLTARECWVRTPDGKEGKVRLPADGSLDAREGHEISVAVMRSAAVDHGRPAMSRSSITRLARGLHLTSQQRFVSSPVLAAGRRRLLRECLFSQLWALASFFFLSLANLLIAAMQSHWATMFSGSRIGIFGLDNLFSVTDS